MGLMSIDEFSQYDEVVANALTRRDAQPEAWVHLAPGDETQHWQLVTDALDSCRPESRQPSSLNIPVTHLAMPLRTVESVPNHDFAYHALRSGIRSSGASRAHSEQSRQRPAMAKWWASTEKP